MRLRTVLSLAAALVLLTLAVPPGRFLPALASAPPARTLPGSVPDVVAAGNAQLLGAHPSSDVLHFAIALPLRNSAGLTSFLQSVNNPASPGYHHFLSQAAVNADFNPTAQQEQAVVQWLRAGGLTVTQTYPNHLLVDAQGSAASVQALLGVTINDYSATVHGQNRTFYAPDRNPTVSSQVSADVLSITGLDSYPRFHMLSNGSAHGAPAYYPQDFANAYDANPLWDAGYTGTGQHIGITLWTVPPSTTTLQAFGTHTGAAVATTANGKLKVIPVDGGTTSSASPDQGEAGMDIEYSGGMAPGATIDYYEAPTDSSGNPTDQGLEDALNMAGTDANNNQQISSSWGGCEASSTSDAFTSAVENIFASNSATGHNYYFSSGDNGSWCDPSGSLFGGTDPYPDYPASSPHVTSVGGTKFNANIGSTWPGESAWAYSSTGNNGNPEGSGGGYSNIFSRPSWQVGTGLAANGKRGYPDIAADADPNTGAYVCYGSSSSCGQIGGTSLASPLWAGMTAVLNQYLAGQGKPAAGFLAPTLYSLAGAGQTYAEYHDVTSGTNGRYNAGAGWDAVTGWGSTDLYNLARDMAGGSGPTPTNTPVPPTPTKTPVPPTPTNTPGGPTPTNTPAPPTPTNTPVPPTPTKTPVPPTPTNTPVRPTPTNTPTPTSSQLVVNGGFESGQSPWSESSAGGYQIVDPTRAHMGSYSAYLCGYNRCNDQIWQTVKLPSSFSKVTLGYWYHSETQESGSTCYDYFYSRIRTTGGASITNPQKSCNAGPTNGWVYESFDVTSALSGYKGQSIQVYFQGTADSSLITNFFVDDVTLTTSQDMSGAGGVARSRLSLLSVLHLSQQLVDPAQHHLPVCQAAAQHRGRQRASLLGA